MPTTDNIDRSPLDIEIRPERGDDQGDVAAIAAVVAAAFGSTLEADLVTAIRASRNYIAEAALVAEHRGRVVGHVMISHVVLRGPGGVRPVASLSPLAVAPDVQRRGVGSALVRHAVSVAGSLGEPLVALQGDPRFYSRLGFEHSSPSGIELNLPYWAPAEAAQMIKLATYDPTLTGTIVDPPYFAAGKDGSPEPACSP
jgi:putative acetyltransferase